MPNRQEYQLPPSCPAPHGSAVADPGGDPRLAANGPAPIQETLTLRLVEIGKLVNVNYLSGLLGISPLQIVQDLTELGRRPHVSQTLTYELAAMVAVKHGFYPVKVG